MKKFNISLFIFRRDLRIQDNTGLIKALELSNYVIPIFIFNKEQIEKENNYRSLNAIQFMIESLIDLEKNLNKKSAKLYLFYGENLKIIEKIKNNINLDAIFVNKDYTPYSTKRDQKISEFCSKNNISFNTFADTLLNEPEDVINSKGENYSIFTPFYKKCIKQEVQEPLKNYYKNYYNQNLKFQENQDIYKKILNQSKELKVKGGRDNGKKIFNKIREYKDYKLYKDFLYYQTTLLSAYNKFGVYSIREVYKKIKENFGKSHELIRQLYWRDFFTHIAYLNPQVFGSAYKEKFNKINWENNKEYFNAWCKGQTGFPIIDAAMTELNQTGYMHNRARLIVGSFLTKDLHIDWQLGEQYFAKNLIDYDPCVNNGNWQWVASTGADAQPYFRIFNPWLQQKKFDPKCNYIKKWLPKFQNLDPKVIHNWDKNFKLYKNINYLAPIIDHKKETSKTKKYLNILINKKY